MSDTHSTTAIPAAAHWTDDEPDLVDEEPEQRREGFTIDTEETAAWAVAKILGYDDEERRLEAGYLAMRADIEGRRERFRAFAQPQLEAYWHAHAPKKGKTIKLLSGSISYRTKPGGAVVVDKAAALAWAGEQRPDLVRVEVKTIESLDVAAVKQHITDTGEIPPGCDVVDDVEVFSIKSAKGGGE